MAAEQRHVYIGHVRKYYSFFIFVVVFFFFFILSSRIPAPAALVATIQLLADASPDRKVPNGRLRKYDPLARLQRRSAFHPQ